MDEAIIGKTCELCGVDYYPPVEMLDCPRCWLGVALPGDTDDIETFGTGVNNETLVKHWRETWVEIGWLEIGIDICKSAPNLANQYEVQVSELSHRLEFTENLKALAEFREVILSDITQT